LAFLFISVPPYFEQLVNRYGYYADSKNKEFNSEYYNLKGLEANVLFIIVPFDMKYKSSYNPPKKENGGNYGKKLE